MLKADIIRLVEAKGWLSIAELTFDNTTRVTVSTTEGAICINKTKGQLYALDISGAGGQNALAYMLNAGVVDGAIYDLSAYYELRIYDLDSLQTFAMQTWHRLGSLDQIIMQGKVIQQPSVNLLNPSFTVVPEADDYAKVFNTMEPTYSTLKLDNPGVFRANFENLRISKDGYDKFKTAQTNFKSYCTAYLALGADLLI